MTVSDKPWSSFTQADYSLEQWVRACLIHLETGVPTAKGQHKLPVREPEGAISRAGAHAAAAVLAGGRGGVDAPPDAKRRAARELVSIYRNDLKEDPPQSLVALARG
jgi:hypothetical protein